MPGDRLDDLLREMREESVSAEEMAGAQERVWQKLLKAEATLCAGFRAELADYQAGRLADARRLLLEDHLSRCAACRRAYAELKGEHKVIAMPAARIAKPGPRWVPWAVAAGVALVALYAGRERIDVAMAPGGARATVETVAGNLYSVAGHPLQKGAALNEGDVVRTAGGTHAVLRLADGSAVEMNERTELAVRAAWSGETVQLERGDVLVEAAKQRRGYLRVVTRDSVVSVKGTVFAVSSGAGGTLVSVVEGSVAVDQAGGQKLLKPGQQTATNPALDGVPVRQAVAWSKEAEKHYALMGEFVKIEKQLAAEPSPALRTVSKLTPYLPANTTVYVAFPNLGGTLRRAANLVEQRAGENATLREWWESKQGEEMKTLLGQVQVVAPMLGEEIVFVMTKSGQNQIPLLMAEVNAGRQEPLKTALEPLVHGSPYQVTDKLLLVSDSPAHLQAMQAQLGQGASGTFADEIAKRYQRGVGWLVALNIEGMSIVTPEPEAAKVLGASQMKHLFFEQRSAHGMEANEASLTFTGARTGVASWIAGPAAAGSGEYVSSEAVFAVSAATRNPKQVLEELVSGIGAGSSSLAAQFAEIKARTNIDVTQDLAAALGTDFTVAVEKPTLPIPAWIAAFEVYQPALLDQTARRFADSVNSELQAHGNQERLALSQETVDGRTWMSAKMSNNPITLYWTYDRGYLVAGTDRAMVTRAIETRASGLTLVRSARFRSQLPPSNNLHYSGFLWLNTGGALAGLSGMVENPTLKNLLENREPLLVVLNGETERIDVASRTRLSSLVLDLMLASGPPNAAKKNVTRN